MIDYLKLLGGLKLKRKIPILITLALALALIISATSMTALAVHEDHTNPNSTAERLTLDSADIVELALGITLTQTERDYLALYGGESMSYSDMVPASYVVSAYDDESGTLTVHARVYEYANAQGLKKTWTPKIATVGEKSAPLVLDGADKYTCEIQGVTKDDTATLDVKYTMSITVSAKTLNTLMNKAFVDAPKWDAYDSYLKAREEYYAAEAAYNAYLVEKSVYDAKLAEYNAYLIELAEYEADLLVYTEYEAALAAYNADYNKYLAYLDAVKAYDAGVAKYEQYLADLKTVDYHLSIIYGTGLKHTSLRRSVKLSIMGDMVSQVLENRDAIANDLTAIDPAVIDNAGYCTDYLRIFYTEYDSLDNVQAQYTYYAMNYEKIRDNFIGLLRSLDLLYTNGKVRLALDNQGLKQKYEILLAQLYCIVTTLSDEPVSNYYGTAYYNSSYRINGKTPLSVLEGTLYMEHLAPAKPLVGGYPTEVKMPDPVTDTVTEPTKPTAVLRPVAPTPVADPGVAPELVARPTSPGTAPAIPAPLENENVLPDVVLALLAEYRGGSITERAALAEGQRITLEATATKKIFGTAEIAINFYDTAGVLLDTVNVERGSYVEFAGAVPTKAEDDAATYTFNGWQDADGNIVDMRAVDCRGSTLDLYPSFAPVYKLYDVTWIVDGKKTVTQERFGVIPTPPFTPEKSDTGSFFYDFTGWNREITPVSTSSSQNTYTATFVSKYIVPFSNGSGARITVDGTDYVIDCTTAPDYTFDLSNIIPRAAGTAGIVIRSKIATVRFSYTEVLAMSELGVKSLSISSQKSGAHAYTFGIDLYDADGNRAGDSVKAALVMSYSFIDPSHARLYYFADDVRNYVKATVTDTTLSATVNCNTTYHAALCYAIDVIANDVLEITVSDTSLYTGETGTITAIAPLGVEIISYYYIKSGGERVDLKSNEFVMPTDNVSVGVVYTYLEYTVKFVSDGTVISIATYKYGEMPTLPADPKKSADTLYSYEFVGWDAEVLAVTGDATYNAVYASTPIPVPPKPDGPQISDRVMDLIVKVAVLGAYACLVVLPLFIVVLAKFIRRMRWLKPRKRS